MPKAIDVRDMNTAIHSLYVIKSKPQIVAKAFRRLAEIDFFENNLEMCDLWKFIEKNTEYLGEYNANTQMFGSRIWRNKHLQSGVTVEHKGIVYNILESVDLW